jgi:hypothetical protein
VVYVVDGVGQVEGVDEPDWQKLPLGHVAMVLLELQKDPDGHGVGAVLLGRQYWPTGHVVGAVLLPLHEVPAGHAI